MARVTVPLGQHCPHCEQVHTKCAGHVDPPVIDAETGERARDPDTGKILRQGGKRPCQFPHIRGGEVCHKHGGSAPQIKAKAAVRDEVMKWGLGDSDVDPGEILLRMVSQSAARAQRYADELEAMVAEHDNLRDALVREAYGEFGPVGEYARGLVVLEAQERDRCAGFATKAIAAGLAERTVRLAERQGALIAEVMRRALEDPRLGLTPAQRKMATATVVRELRSA